MMRYREFKKIQSIVTDETIFVMENTPVPTYVTKHTFGVFSTKVFLPKIWVKFHWARFFLPVHKMMFILFSICFSK